MAVERLVNMVIKLPGAMLDNLAKGKVGGMIVVGDTIKIDVNLQTADLITDVLIVEDGIMDSTTAGSAWEKMGTTLMAKMAGGGK